MTTPNFLTVVAAGIYSVCPQIGKPALSWSGLSPDQKKPYTTAANFLSSYAFGRDVSLVDRDKAAASLEAMAIPGLEDANTNVLVNLFVNVHTTMV